METKKRESHSEKFGHSLHGNLISATQVACYICGEIEECAARPIRLCNNCVLNCLGHIIVEKQKLTHFYPSLFKKYCECPCHHPKKARLKGIELVI